jgi:hypothetical protein
MKARFNTEHQREPISQLSTANGEGLENESEPLREGVRSLRDSLRSAAEMPNAFWTRQRATILGNLRPTGPASKLRPALLWAPAFVLVLVFLFLFAGKKELPAPDFAVGADQNLLVDVERALSRDCPAALAPAEALVREIR